MCKHGGKILSNHHSEIRESLDGEFIDSYLHCCLCLICLLFGSLLPEEMVHYTKTMERIPFRVADISHYINTFLMQLNTHKCLCSFWIYKYVWFVFCVMLCADLGLFIFSEALFNGYFRTYNHYVKFMVPYQCFGLLVKVISWKPLLN